jgi:hypothetical protein
MSSETPPVMVVGLCPQVLADLRSRLLAKQRRERAYLERRAARGIHTPTDAAYAADQDLEETLLSLLERLLAACEGGG